MGKAIDKDSLKKGVTLGMQKWCIADFPEESDKGEIESSYSEFCQREENKPGGEGFRHPILWSG